MTIPTYIITGFLGSGKTTLLNRLLAYSTGLKTAVIENEYGSESIDSSLISSSANLNLDLSSGCLCHDLRNEFLDMLNRIVEQKRAEGLHLLLVEASGISDPALIAEPFRQVDLIKKYFDLRGILTVVNAETMEDEVSDFELARQQISSADILYIARSENVRPAYLESQRSGMLQTLNPFAQILHDSEQAAENTILNFSRQKELEIEPIPKTHEDINTVTLKLKGAFDKGKLFGLLHVLLLIQGNQFYRIKGWVWLEGTQRPQLLNALRHSFVLEDPQENIKDKIKPMENTIVLIGKSLKQKAIESKFVQCLSKHKPLLK